MIERIQAEKSMFFDKIFFQNECYSILIWYRTTYICIMKKRIVSKTALFAMLLSIGLLTSCNSDDVGGNLYTFKEKLMGQYLQADTSFSEFSKLIEMTKIKGLLNSYGSYTCFAPTNTAMRTFYKLKGKHALEDFTADSLKLMAYDHIINGATIMAVDFRKGVLPVLSMSDRSLLVSFSDTNTFINKDSRIIQKDIVVHNGVIHCINKNLEPVRDGIASVISKDTTFRLFYSALEATGLVDSLLKTVDETYSLTPTQIADLEAAVNTTIASERHAPTSRKFGYTVLMESDKTMREHGITNLESMKAYAKSIYDEVYPADANIDDITNRSNSLNRFIAYHLIDKQISYTKFINDYYTAHMSRIVDLYEYIETMCPNTLMEVKFDRISQTGNRFNTNSENGNFIGIVPTNYDNQAVNGYYHELNDMLTYNTDVVRELGSKRLRFDFASIFPELTNNNMRGRPSDNAALLYRNALPKGYLDKLDCTEQTVVCYSNAHDKLMNYEGDEVFLVVQNGKLYDFTVTTPPVPAGTYEVRFGYQSNGRRGVAQFYVDGVPAGVPVNLNTLGSNVQIGWIAPGTDADDALGFQNDKMMRNRGYMKGPNSFKAVSESWYAGSSARYNGSNLRKILGIYTFPKDGPHKIMVKGLSGGQFQIDFLEFVPTNILENEDIN